MANAAVRRKRVERRACRLRPGACILVLGLAIPGGALAQSPGAAGPRPAGEVALRPGPGRGASARTAPGPVRGIAPPHLRLYSPDVGPEPLGAAAEASVAAGLRLAGRAVYHPRPAMTVLDLEARLRPAPGLSLSVRLSTLHHMPGRRLPLQYRGRERRLTVGIGVPVGLPD